MDFREYQAGAATTWGKQHLPEDLFERLDELGVAADDVAAIRAQGDRLTLGVLGLGLAGEAGEVADEVKKFVGHGHWKDGFDAEKELGDVLWYVAGLATALGLDLETIAIKNAIKLGIRYENGFSTAASKARVDLDHDCNRISEPWGTVILPESEFTDSEGNVWGHCTCGYPAPQVRFEYEDGSFGLHVGGHGPDEGGPE